MKSNYDVVIVGAGPAGIMAAYELIGSGKEVLLIDKGLDIYTRTCPIKEGHIKKCPVLPNGEVGCLPSCSITAGFGGAGAFSDGKFNITTEFGGWLTEYMSNSKVEEIIRYVDSINLKHGAVSDLTDPTTDHVREIERKGLAGGLKLLRAEVRHLGTEQNLEILKSIFEHIKANGVDMVFGTKVDDVVIENNEAKAIVVNGETITANQVVLAPGRNGAKWLNNLLKANGLDLLNNRVDIGVRVETNDAIMAEINEHLYEGKFIYNTKYGTQVRTFCSNPSGQVVVENHNGTMLANGHAYKAKELKSTNTNFALLVSHKFTKPFNQPNEFAHEVGNLANKLAAGGIIVQRYGDIKMGRRSNEKRMAENFVRPTLEEAIPGDLGLALPYVTMQSLIDMTEALEAVSPGIASDSTLFYGVEAKFYSARPELDSNLMTKVNNLYAIGDGAGITRGLAQAGAAGVVVARAILNK